jgi:hypothetical protein
VTPVFAREVVIGVVVDVGGGGVVGGFVVDFVVVDVVGEHE